MHFFCHNMFTQCDIIKNWEQCYLHKMTSSKFGVTLFDTALQRCVIWYQFQFIAKTEEFVVFM